MKTLSGNEFQYRMLSRLKADCDFFLGAGNRNVKHLWGLNIDNHINEMKFAWNSLDEKPEWCTWEDILKYEKKMKG